MGTLDAPDKSRGAGFQPAKNPEKTAGYKPAPRENRTLVGRVTLARIFTLAVRIKFGRHGFQSARVSCPFADSGGGALLGRLTLASKSSDAAFVCDGSNPFNCGLEGVVGANVIGFGFRVVGCTDFAVHRFRGNPAA
jgi:hypothetical protein